MDFSSYEQQTTTSLTAPKKERFFLKIVFLVLFIAGDIFINATSNYESLKVTSLNKTLQLHTLLFIGQITLQFCITSVLCLILFQTLPFQVGKWGHFKTILMWFLIFQSLYLILSCTAGGMRLGQITRGNTDALSRSWFYSTVSFLRILGE